MAHFAFVQDGIVQRVHVLANDVLVDENGQEDEQLGQVFLAALHGGDPDQYVQTSYNGNLVHGQDRGPYAWTGYTWDGSTFTEPGAADA